MSLKGTDILNDEEQGISIEERRKQDAYELALLIYSMYKDSEEEKA
jgi:hypothetical protein